MVNRLNLIFLIIVFSSFFSSLISNGIVVRPHANYIYYLVLALVYVDLKSKEVKQTKKE